MPNGCLVLDNTVAPTPSAVMAAVAVRLHTPCFIALSSVGWRVATLPDFIFSIFSTKDGIIAFFFEIGILPDFIFPIFFTKDGILASFFEIGILPDFIFFIDGGG